MSAVLELANLPTISDARLPAAYAEAKRALSTLARIDECQDWADRAEAMASYARQARDDTLRKMADRVQARAIRRCGELLKQVPQAKGARTDVEPQDGADPRLTRTQAATDAGLSERQRKTALRVAAVPEDEFEEQVESEAPPTVTQLAEQGKRQGKPAVDLHGIPPNDYAKATAAIGTLRRFAEYCGQNAPTSIAHAMQSHEIDALREHMHIVRLWLDRFEADLPAVPIKPPAKLTGRGGAGRGQGRKPRGDVVSTELAAVRMTPAEKAKYTALGGAAWLREVLGDATPGGAK